MATATGRTARKTNRTSPAKAKASSKRAKRFDAQDSAHWHEIPSKGMLFSLAIAAFNGAKFPGSEILGSREACKEIISAAKENGQLD